MTDEALSLALAQLSPDLRARVRELLRLGWPLEAERMLAQVLSDPAQAKAIIAAMVRRTMTQ